MLELLAGLFPGKLWVYVGAAALLLVLGGTAAGYVTYKVEHGALVELKLADAQALTLAVARKAIYQHAQDQIVSAAAIGEGHAQLNLTLQFSTLTAKVPTYVTPAQDSAGCVSVGLARVLRAASTNADPGALSLAPGQSDDDCSDLAPSALAGWFTAYAEASAQNSEQLNALEDSIHALAEAPTK